MLSQNPSLTILACAILGLVILNLVILDQSHFLDIINLRVWDLAILLHARCDDLVHCTITASDWYSHH